MSGNKGDIETDYLDFNIASNRVQLKLTQLQDNSNLEFSLVTSFYERDSQGTTKASLTYSWNTHSGRSNKLSLYDFTEFDQCDETKSELSASIPTLITIDLNTDYLVEITGEKKGTFSSASTEPCPAIWTSFKNNRASIKKVIIKLEDEDSGYKLDDYYGISYRVITGKYTKHRIHDYYDYYDIMTIMTGTTFTVCNERHKHTLRANDVQHWI